jgi:hypothetical protein
VKLSHLYHLPKMVEKFELKNGHEVEWRKNSQLVKTYDKAQIQLNVDRDVNLQKWKWEHENLQASNLK